MEIEKKGIPRLLTSQGFKTAYTDYQQHMIDELNTMTDGMPSAIAIRGAIRD